MSTFKDAQLAFRDYNNLKDTNILGINVGTFSLDPANITTLTSLESSVTIRGVNVGDVVFLNVPASLHTGLAFSGVRVSAANTIALRLSNFTGSDINDTARTWTYTWIRLS